MSFKSLKVTFIVLLASVGVNTTVKGQDLIARQAPIDKKLNLVDSLTLQKQIESEKDMYPALSLYSTWSTASVHNYYGVPVPNEYEIDLTGFVMPTTNTRITSKFGYRWRRMHKGLDVKVNVGDTIVAAFDGKVRVVRYERRGYGKYVVIRHYNGLETIYGHLSEHLVKENDVVKAGDVIGLGGNTGRSTGSHLHFETRFLGIAIDPAKMFDFPNQDIVSDTFVFRKTTAKKAANTSAAYYRVRKGDTLSAIAGAKGVSVRTLCNLNGIKSTSILRPGQMLRCY